jgi:hypothetical protein
MIRKTLNITPGVFRIRRAAVMLAIKTSRVLVAGGFTG